MHFFFLRIRKWIGDFVLVNFANSRFFIRHSIPWHQNMVSSRLSHFYIKQVKCFPHRKWIWFSDIINNLFINIQNEFLVSKMKNFNSVSSKSRFFFVSNNFLILIKEMKYTLILGWYQNVVSYVRALIILLQDILL